MRYAFSVEAVRAAEAEVIAVTGALPLMRRAAGVLRSVTIDLLKGATGGVAGRQVVVLVGSGNNGGDALFAAAGLVRRGAHVTAIALTAGMHPEAEAAFRREGGRVLPRGATPPQAHLVIDGIVGIGGRGPLRPEAATLARALRAIPTVAVDVPSGVDPDDGTVADPERAIRADVTVAFGCLKPGLLLAPGRDQCGTVVVADIGLDDALNRRRPAAGAVDADDLQVTFPAPIGTAYKYSRGVLGVAAGSSRYPGAAMLVTGAARSCGLGMVRAFGPDDLIRPVIQRYPDVVAAGPAPASEPRVNAWVIGPGLGTGPTQQQVLAALLAGGLPLVVDADALTMVAGHDSLRTALVGRRATTVLTPHLGELRRLGYGPQPDRIALTKRAAAELGCIVVNKGPATVVADSGGRAWVDTFGTSALATAGTGDVLSGIVAAALATSAGEPEERVGERVAAAVALHGWAGRIAAAQRRPVNAPDVLAAVAAAIAAVRDG